ncbi:FlaD/FlaE family flagellar protein [Methanolobus sp. WCC4]|uniref:FlaD/FlaE family flagellar protein n=1 Tax=Methanolobus sp. WCC4 TaxID=3125784 RepID=UPI0030F6B71C
MSELPWENKKIAEIMSSAGEESKITDSPAPGLENGSNPPIPDILANAFADMPMEEAKIEAPDSGSDPDVLDVQMPEMAAPAFGDLPDLSMLSNNEDETPDVQVPEVDSPSAGLPPLMGDTFVRSSSSNSDIIDQVTKPLFDPDSLVPGGVNAGTVPAEPKKRSSPPPLFEPFLPSDENTETDHSVESSIPALDAANPFNAPASDVVNPFDSPVSADANSFNPPASDNVNPFDSPVSADANPFNPPASDVVNPFDSPVSADANPFNPPASDNVNPFDVPVSADTNSFNPPASDNVNPFDSPVSADANPFNPPASDSVNPFDSPVPADANLFNPPASDNVNPFDVPVSADANPFNAPASGSVNPFDASPSADGNPFNAPASGSVNPFEAPPSVDYNPFASSVPGQEKSSSNNIPGSLGGKTNINIDALKKNIQDLSFVAKGFLKNLTKGKSLIERMEDMKDVPSLDASGQEDDIASSMSSSPFEDEHSSPFETPSADPFQKAPVFKEGAVLPGQSDPFEMDMGAGTEDDIRKITPIEAPVMAAEDLPSFEEDTGALASEPNQECLTDPMPELSDIAEIVPVDPVKDLDISRDEADELPEGYGIAIDGESGEEVKADAPVLSEMHDMSAEISSELQVMKKRSDEKFNRLEDNIFDFKDDLSNIDVRFGSLKGDVESFSDKLLEIDSSFSSFVKSNDEALSRNESQFSGIEEKISSVEVKMGDFESNLSVLQSDNMTIRSDLSRIEDSVSELVNSYTALLGQLHESLQENESNFSRIDVITVKLDEIGTKIGSIEKIQEDARSTSVELSRSISSIVDNLGTTSSAFSEFKQESETKNAEMLEKVDSVTEYVESELKKLGAKSYKGFGQNVHLSNIVKNSGNMKLCMEWLEFLMGLVGRNNLPDILSYYEELGWITEKVRMELLHYADGIDFYMEKPDWKLTPDDHVKSIWFIESLAGMKVDKNRLSVIERDVEKVKKGSEIYGI